MKNIYLCGPTVYSSSHIGNMRPIISFDIFIRSQIFIGEKINFIHNITDIDDKIIKKSIEKNKTEKEISEKYKKEYKKTLIDMNILKPQHMPTITNNIDFIIEFIKKLIKNKAAYELDGDVYFSTHLFKNYGEISNQNINELIYEKSKKKKHPSNFAIWKKTNIGIQFDSPWSKGRPGWHTECSALIYKYLKGASLFIHGGGSDLIFPHHENENIQYFSIFNKNITNKWKHIGQVKINGDKMSKSLKNIWLSMDFIKLYDADTLRLLFLSSNPTKPINLKDFSVKQFYELKNKFKFVFKKAQLEKESEINIKNIVKEISDWKWSEALKKINQEIKEFQKNKKNASNIIEIMKLIGFNFSKNIITQKDKNLYLKWLKLQKQEKYIESDRIRSILLEKKII